jgi:hypothetical protein
MHQGAAGDRSHHAGKGRGSLEHGSRHRDKATASLDRAGGRHRRARFRRSAPATAGDDRHTGARIPARPRSCGGAARRRCVGARGWTLDRGGRGARAFNRDSRQRSAPFDPRRLASRQSTLADADHAKGPSDPPRSRHRGDGEGTWRTRDRNRSAVRSGRRRLCRRRPWPRCG